MARGRGILRVSFPRTLSWVVFYGMRFGAPFFCGAYLVWRGARVNILVHVPESRGRRQNLGEARLFFRPRAEIILQRQTMGLTPSIEYF